MSPGVSPPVFLVFLSVLTSCSFHPSPRQRDEAGLLLVYTPQAVQLFTTGCPLKSPGGLIKILMLGLTSRDSDKGRMRPGHWYFSADPGVFNVQPWMRTAVLMAAQEHRKGEEEEAIHTCKFNEIHFLPREEIRENILWLAGQKPNSNCPNKRRGWLVS